MDALLERCAGLDVHQETVVACIMYGPLDRKPKQEIKTFSTTTKGLLELHDWLHQYKCTHVAMESTGVYWKPVWNVLEGVLRWYWPTLNESRMFQVERRTYMMRLGLLNYSVAGLSLLVLFRQKRYGICAITLVIAESCWVTLRRKKTEYTRFYRMPTSSWPHM